MPGKRFNSLGDCRRYLAGLIRRADPGTPALSPEVAGRLCFLVNSMKGILTASDLENRIVKLEEKLRRQEGEQ